MRFVVANVERLLTKMLFKSEGGNYGVLENAMTRSRGLGRLLVLDPSRGNFIK